MLHLAVGDYLISVLSEKWTLQNNFCGIVDGKKNKKFTHRDGMLQSLQYVSQSQWSRNDLEESVDPVGICKKKAIIFVV